MKPFFLLCFLVLPLSASAQWEVRMTGLPTDGTFQEVALADSSTAWVCASSKIYHTTDLGKTWTVASTPIGYGYASVMATWTHTTLIYGSDGGRIIRTTDGGEHWAVVFADSSVTVYINDIAMFDSLHGFAMGDPPDDTKRPGLLTTSDGGASWQVVPNDLPVGDFQIRDRTTFVRPNLGWTKVRNDGIYKTTNGGLNWQRIYTEWAPHTIYFLNDSVGFYSTFGSPTGLYRTTDGGVTWTQKLSVPPLHWVRWAPGGEVLWAGRDTLYKSTDMGESWQPVLKNASGTLQDAAFFKDDIGVVAGTGTVLTLVPPSAPKLPYFPLHVGDTWYYNDPPPGSNAWHWKTIRDSLSIGGRTYFTWRFGDGVDIIDTIRSDNIGNIWQYRGGEEYLRFNFHADSGSTYLYESKERFGDSVYNRRVSVWTNVTQTTPSGTFDSCVRFLFNIPQVVDEEVWYTFAPGIGLVQQVNDGWSRLDLTGALINGATVLSAEEGDALPGRFDLSQNYPNPFNPMTTIRYALPRRSHVTLTVFNTLGQKVATLLDSEVEPGYHEVQVEARNLASGVYIYRLVAGSYRLSRTMLLLR